MSPTETHPGAHCMKPRVTVTSTLALIGKSFAVKLEKAPDKSEINVAHLKFSGLYLQREQIDQLLQRDVGWAQRCFFDELGDPTLMLQIAVPALEVTVTGMVLGRGEARLKLMQAELSSVTLTLCRLGAQMAGELAWVAAGDEVSDVDDLLGREVLIEWEIHDGAQQTIFDSLRNVRATEDGGLEVEGRMRDGTPFTITTPGDKPKRGRKGGRGQAEARH